MFVTRAAAGSLPNFQASLRTFPGHTASPVKPLRLPLAPPRSPLDNPHPISRSQPGSHDHLEVCYSQLCDIDPMILRVRQLRHQGDFPRARCLEQELMPLC